MNIIKYTFEEDLLNRYSGFLKDHYKSDKRIEQQIFEIKSQLSKQNPFFQFGRIQSFLVEEKETIVGHCTAIIDNRNNEVGLIGFYDCIKNEAISKILLTKAISWLKENDCTKIKGPVNLTIWSNYRFIINHKSNADIFDPFAKDYYPEQWKKVGFIPDGKYVSAIRNDFNYVLPYTKDAYTQLKKEGFNIRCLDMLNIENDLEILRSLANNIFKESWNFVELSRLEFKSIYNKILSVIDPNFIEIVENKNRKPLGFCFSMPNPMNKNQIIMKTIGILKEYQRKNIGAALLYSQHLKAKKANYKEFYYPLIRVGNNVTKLPYEGSEIITEYATYELAQ